MHAPKSQSGLCLDNILNGLTLHRDFINSALKDHSQADISNFPDMLHELRIRDRGKETDICPNTPNNENGCTIFIYIDNSAQMFIAMSGVNIPLIPGLTDHSKHCA